MLRLISALFFASTAIAAAQPPAFLPLPFGEQSQQRPSVRPPPPQQSHTAPHQGACPSGQAEVWVNPHGQGEVFFVGVDALWHIGERMFRLPIGGGGTGIPVRIAGSGEAAVPHYWAETTWADSVDGKPYERSILIWNDHVFYPECRPL